MKCIYELSLVQSCKGGGGTKVAKVDQFSGQGIVFVFFVSWKHNFGTLCFFLVKRFYCNKLCKKKNLSVFRLIANVKLLLV